MGGGVERTETPLCAAAFTVSLTTTTHLRAAFQIVLKVLFINAGAVSLGGIAVLKEHSP